MKREPITAKEYQRFTVTNWSKGYAPGPLRSLAIMSLGIAGESGEVCDILKKFIRTGKPMDRKALTLELGDLLYYVNRTAAQFGIPIEQVMSANVRKIERRNRKQKNWKTEKNT